MLLSQVGENEPFIVELLATLTGITQDLQPHQINSFYETVGLMISADTEGRRDMYLVRLGRQPFLCHVRLYPDAGAAALWKQARAQRAKFLLRTCTVFCVLLQACVGGMILHVRCNANAAVTFIF